MPENLARQTAATVRSGNSSFHSERAVAPVIGQSGSPDRAADLAGEVMI